MKTLRRTVLAVAAACLLLPGTAFGQAEDAEALVNDLIQQVTDAANEAGIPAQDLLNGEVPFEVDTDNPVVTLRQAIEALAGDLEVPQPGRIEGTNPHATGILGLPELQVGQQFHLYLDTSVEVFITPQTPLGIPPAQLPEEPDVGSHYDEMVSDYSPDTPLLPVINPLILLAGQLPAGLEELYSPIVLLHTGGKLKSVQGHGWDFGTHLAGNALIGQNVNTHPREATVADPFPIYVPFFTGDTLEDERVDFVGFGEVIQGQTCVAPVVNIPFVGQRIQGRVCAGIGTIIGDGAAFYNHSSIDLRQTLMPLWREAPQEVKDVIALVDELVAEAGLNDVLGEVLGLLGEVPEVPEL